MTEDELKSLPPDGDVETVIVEPKPVTAQPEKSAVDEAAERFAAQRKALEETANAERQARLEAERHAHDRDREATRYRTEAQASELQLVTNAIDATVRERDAAKRDLQRAMEAGEWDKVTDAQDALSMANARLVQYERDKASIDPNRGKPSTTGRVAEQQPQPAAVDPVERFIASATPATQSWLRQNRQYVQTDARGMPKLDSRVMAAHYQAEADGIQPDTPDYFAFIEGRLNPKVKPTQDDADDEPAVKQTRRQTPVAAPVSRDPPSATGQRTTRIHLTRDQVEAAHQFGDPKKSTRDREIDYFNHLKALEAEGRIGNTRH